MKDDSGDAGDVDGHNDDDGGDEGGGDEVVTMVGVMVTKRNSKQTAPLEAVVVVFKKALQ